MAKKKNPVLEQKYWQGREDQRITDIAAFAIRMQRIEKIKGIGPKRLKAIFEEMDKPFTDVERKKVREYERRLREDDR
mgnify:CR=1 FL=1